MYQAFSSADLQIGSMQFAQHAELKVGILQITQPADLKVGATGGLSETAATALAQTAPAE